MNLSDFNLTTIDVSREHKRAKSYGFLGKIFLTSNILNEIYKDVSNKYEVNGRESVIRDLIKTTMTNQLQRHRMANSINHSSPKHVIEDVINELTASTKEAVTASLPVTLSTTNTRSSKDDWGHKVRAILEDRKYEPVHRVQHDYNENISSDNKVSELLNLAEINLKRAVPNNDNRENIPEIREHYSFKNDLINRTTDYRDKNRNKNLHIAQKSETIEISVFDYIWKHTLNDIFFVDLDKLVGKHISSIECTDVTYSTQFEYDSSFIVVNSSVHEISLLDREDTVSCIAAINELNIADLFVDFNDNIVTFKSNTSIRLVMGKNLAYMLGFNNDENTVYDEEGDTHIGSQINIISSRPEVKSNLLINDDKQHLSIQLNVEAGVIIPSHLKIKYAIIYT